MSRRKSILVLDDSEIVLEVLRGHLEAAGFEVLCARNLDEFEQGRLGAGTDLILLDVQMPELFGDDVAMVLRRSCGVHCPIYLLSSMDEPELARRAAAAGVDGFVCKKDGMQAVVHRIRQILSEVPDRG